MDRVSKAEALRACAQAGQYAHQGFTGFWVTVLRGTSREMNAVIYSAYKSRLPAGVPRPVRPRARRRAAALVNRGSYNKKEI